MNIQEYKSKIKEVRFEEYPYFIGNNPLSLGDFVDFEETTLELKIYLIKLIICRCFSPTGGIAWPQNPEWFIKNFLSNYKRDLIKPWLTPAIREAIEMIMSDDVFAKVVVGTTFMFGVIEFYAKYKLGFRPNDYDFFDSNKKSYIKSLYNNPKRVPTELSIGKAFDFLQKKDLSISKSLNDIDEHNDKKGIREERYTVIKISDRINMRRNCILHGENHFFYDEGEYLVMLYLLFYYHDVLEQQ